MIPQAKFIRLMWFTIVLHLLDLVTTALTLGAGGYEANRFARWIIENYGGLCAAFVKMALLLLLIKLTFSGLEIFKGSKSERALRIIYYYGWAAMNLLLLRVLFMNLFWFFYIVYFIGI